MIRGHTSLDGQPHLWALKKHLSSFVEKLFRWTPVVPSRSKSSEWARISEIFEREVAIAASHIEIALLLLITCFRLRLPCVSLSANALVSQLCMQLTSSLHVRTSDNRTPSEIQSTFPI
jgi:hypothetical protein